MMIQASCPGCGRSYRVGEEFAGKKIRCKNGECQRVFSVTAVSQNDDFIDEDYGELDKSPSKLPARRRIAPAAGTGKKQPVKTTKGGPGGLPAVYWAAGSLAAVAVLIGVVWAGMHLARQTGSSATAGPQPADADGPAKVAADPIAKAPSGGKSTGEWTAILKKGAVSPETVQATTAMMKTGPEAIPELVAVLRSQDFWFTLRPKPITDDEKVAKEVASNWNALASSDDTVRDVRAKILHQTTNMTNPGSSFVYAVKHTYYGTVSLTMTTAEKKDCELMFPMMSSMETSLTPNIRPQFSGDSLVIIPRHEEFIGSWVGLALLRIGRPVAHELTKVIQVPEQARTIQELGIFTDFIARREAAAILAELDALEEASPALPGLKKEVDKFTADHKGARVAPGIAPIMLAIKVAKIRKEKSVAALAAALEDEIVCCRAEAAIVLARLGKAALPAAETLVRLLRADDPLNRITFKPELTYLPTTSLSDLKVALPGNPDSITARMCLLTALKCIDPNQAKPFE